MSSFRILARPEEFRTEVRRCDIWIVKSVRGCSLIFIHIDRYEGCVTYIVQTTRMVMHGLCNVFAVAS
jgi:hypothetical protein